MGIVKSADRQTSVLLIDDEPNLLFAMARVLKRFGGFEVDTASDGVIGLERIRQRPPDIIICDMMMPNMDGLKVKAAINQEERIADIPFIFLTARSFQNDKLVGFLKGADDYIIKPCQPEELVERVNAVLRRHEIGRRQGRIEAAVMAEQALRFIYQTGQHANKMTQCVEQIVHATHFLERTLKMRTREEFEAKLDALQNASLFPVVFVSFSLTGLSKLEVRIAGNILTQVIEAIFETLGAETMLFRVGLEQFIMLIPRGADKLKPLIDKLRGELTLIHAASEANRFGLNIGASIAHRGDRLSASLNEAETKMRPYPLEPAE